LDEQEIVKEFLIESAENVARIEQQIVRLETNPRDPELLAGTFRAFHTIKGTCGFLAFSNLERLTHAAENLLSQLRAGHKSLTGELTSLILEAVDVIKGELAHIESAGKESGSTYEELRERFSDDCSPVAETPQEAPAAERIPVPVDTAPPAQPGPEAERGSSRGAAVADSTIRVDVGLLDKLMNLVGELVLARNQILQFDSLHEDQGLSSTAQRLNLITTQLQEGVMKTRMQPIGGVWSALPRVVRDIAASCGKQIHLELDGADTELDKSIIEAVKDPLTHIVRNSCDHGIELPAVRTRNGKPSQGRLSMRACHEGGQVTIEVADDGAGIDVARIRRKAVEKGLIGPEQAERLSEREALHLVFLPGLSTAEQVTSISGRGVGMDVVRTNIEKIGGVVDLSSRPGEGATVRIRIPLTLAIIPGLVVSSGGERFVIPQVSLLELLRLEGESGRRQIERIHGSPVYRRRGALLPVAFLNDVLHLPGGSAGEVLNIVVLQAEDRQFGLVVDEINDTQEIVVKPLGKQLKGLIAYSGATIMGDGKVALILDVPGIGQMSGVLGESHDPPRAAAARSEASAADLQSFLLFSAGKFERLAVPLSLVARLEEFPASRIERAGNRLAVQYRDRILQLTRLASVLDSADQRELADPVQVIVFSEGDRMMGLIVDQILDIHHENICGDNPAGSARAIVNRRQKRDCLGFLGSAVIGGKVTDFLDLAALLRGIDESWSEEDTPRHAPPTTVLIVDDHGFSRGLTRNYLELAGHRVMEARSSAEALEKLERSGIGAVVTSLNGQSGGDRELANRMRSHEEFARIPILTLGKSPADGETRQDDFLACCSDRFDQRAVLQSLEQLLHAVAPVESRGNGHRELAGSRR
jgi:two-component system chemotaxis sensor kinase CheA